MIDAHELAEGMMSDSYARRFATRIAATGDNRVRTPEDVLGERLLRWAFLIEYERRSPGRMVIGKPSGEEGVLDYLVKKCVWACSAPPYLWTEAVRTSLRDIEVPRHVISPRLLPHPVTWHTFETGVNLGGELEYHGRTYVATGADAYVVSDFGQGVEILLLGEMVDAETSESVPMVTGGFFEYGQTWPDDFDDEKARFLQGPLVMFSFLNSPFIPKRQERPSRAARREALRNGSEAADDLVTFIVLRRPEHRRRRPSEEGEPVEWRHRWLVSGHLRAQWYPSEQAHRLIWIAPYLKGPEDAPMIDHAYKVAR